MQKGSVVVSLCGIFLLVVGCAAHFQCVKQDSGRLCTIMPTSDVANTPNVTVVDPSECRNLQRMDTFQYCNRNNRTESCLGVNCNKPCRRFYMDDCKCDVLVVGPVKNECMARYQADYIAYKQGIPPNNIKIEVIDDATCAGRPRATVERYNCTANATSSLCA